MPPGAHVCPYGGVCHACPARVQAKLAIGEWATSTSKRPTASAEQILQKPTPQMQRRVVSETAPADIPSIVHEVLRSPGQPLDAAVREFMEPRFGYDLRCCARAQGCAGIRIGVDVEFTGIHCGPRCGFCEWAICAGHDRRPTVLAHELTHVAQQRSAARIQRLPAAPTGGLSDAMLVQIARRLREAMAGWGTDEDAIYAAFSGRTQVQVDAIAGYTSGSIPAN